MAKTALKWNLLSVRGFELGLRYSIIYKNYEKKRSQNWAIWNLGIIESFSLTKGKALSCSLLDIMCEKVCETREEQNKNLSEKSRSFSKKHLLGQSYDKRIFNEWYFTLKFG